MGCAKGDNANGGLLFARRLKKQTTCKVGPAGCGKTGAHVVALLGIAGPATSCVVRLVIIPLPALGNLRVHKFLQGIGKKRAGFA